MKKILSILFICSLAACVPDAGKEDGKPTTSDPSCKVKAVKDPTMGKIYYSPSHRLYKHVSNFDHRYCTEGEASKAGYSKAPDRFPNSTAEYIECLDGEGTSGNCHNYVSGIYQSLKIYDRVCGPDNISKEELASTVKSYARRDEDRMDVDRYNTIANAMLDKYSCRSSSKSSSKPSSNKKKK